MGHGLGALVLAAASVSGSSLVPEPSGDVETYLIREGFSASDITQVRAGTPSLPPAGSSF